MFNMFQQPSAAIGQADDTFGSDYGFLDVLWVLGEDAGRSKNVKKHWLNTWPCQQLVSGLYYLICLYVQLIFWTFINNSKTLTAYVSCTV